MFQDLRIGQWVRCNTMAGFHTAPEVGKIVAFHNTPTYTITEVQFPDWNGGHCGTDMYNIDRKDRLYLTQEQIIEGLPMEDAHATD